MTLKYKYESKDLIPAEQLPLYAERDGAWHLEVEGAVDKERLDEFRSNNLALIKERDELKQRFEGIDPEQARTWLADKAKLEQERQAQRSDAEKLAAAKAELEQQIASVAGERDTLHARLASIQIDQGVVTAAIRHGLRQSAIPDITARARAALKLVKGVPAVIDGDGKTPRAGKDGVTPMTLEEWLDTQVSEAPHLFEANAGGGAAGNASGGGAKGHLPVKNPYRKDTWNLTEQVRLQKTDPQLAARLKSAAA